MATQPYTSVKYAKDVFQDSLLTGIPQIVQTRNIGRKILKSIVLCLCVIGFIYQTTEFMKIFWSYPTVMDIDVEYPEVIQSPAITYCNLNGIKRTMYCKRHPENCASPRNLTSFCKVFPELCKNRYAGDLRAKLTYPTGNGLLFEGEATVEDLEKFGHTSNGSLQYCNRISMDGTDLIRCSWETIIRMPMADGNTGYRNCYTMFSSLNSTQLKQHTLPVPKKKDALFHMVFDAEPNEYFRPDRQAGIIVAIHSPDRIANPFYDGFVIKPGNLYNVHMKVVEEKLLPFPYETKCKDYNTMWEQRGKKGPLSQEMCLGECVYNASMKLCNCVLPNIMYYHKDRICTDDELDCFDFNISECYSYCQQPCDFTDFEYDVQERKLEDITVDTIDTFYERDSITNRHAVVLIFLKRPEIIIYNHRPQYEIRNLPDDVKMVFGIMSKPIEVYLPEGEIPWVEVLLKDIEVFSFMGGYVGMWLGVSLIAVFDFVESVYLVVTFWIQRRLRLR